MIISQFPIAAMTTPKRNGISYHGWWWLGEIGSQGISSNNNIDYYFTHITLESTQNKTKSKILSFWADRHHGNT